MTSYLWAKLLGLLALAWVQVAGAQVAAAGAAPPLADWASRLRAVRVTENGETLQLRHRERCIAGVPEEAPRTVLVELTATASRKVVSRSWFARLNAWVVRSAIARIRRRLGVLGRGPDGYAPGHGFACGMATAGDSGHDYLIHLEYSAEGIEMVIKEFAPDGTVSGEIGDTFDFAEVFETVGVADEAIEQALTDQAAPVGADVAPSDARTAAGDPPPKASAVVPVARAAAAGGAPGRGTDGERVGDGSPTVGAEAVPARAEANTPAGGSPAVGADQAGGGFEAIVVQLERIGAVVEQQQNGCSALASGLQAYNAANAVRLSLVRGLDRVPDDSGEVRAAAQRFQARFDAVLKQLLSKHEPCAGDPEVAAAMARLQR